MTIDEVIAELEQGDTALLRDRWRQLFGTPPPIHAGRDLLLRALGYRLQEKAEGGLNRAARSQLGWPIGNASIAAESKKRPTRRLKPGTRLVREWRGVTHHVAVTDTGFEYRDTTYSSLSRIAREITGTRWSGPRFFGLHLPASPVLPVVKLDAGNV